MELTDWEDVDQAWFDQNKSDLPESIKKLTFQALKKLVDPILALNDELFKQACKALPGTVKKDGDEWDCHVGSNGKGFKFDEKEVVDSVDLDSGHESRDSSYGIVTNVSIGLTT